MSIDSGGNLDGYIGDLCRMAVLGEPDGELEDLLGEVRAIQDAVRAPVRAGFAEEISSRSPSRCSRPLPRAVT